MERVRGLHEAHERSWIFRGTKPDPMDTNT
jgi:hypothetical protein